MPKKGEKEALPNAILGEFGSQIQSLITKVVGKKTKELEAKEKELKAREEKVIRVLNNQHVKGKIKIQVGDREFFTTADILGSVKETYFTGRLFIKELDYLLFLKVC